MSKRRIYFGRFICLVIGIGIGVSIDSYLRGNFPPWIVPYMFGMLAAILTILVAVIIGGALVFEEVHVRLNEDGDDDDDDGGEDGDEEEPPDGNPNGWYLEVPSSPEVKTTPRMTRWQRIIRFPSRAK